ncbi:CD63 antigen-like [Xenia sp. Carnegie-2017]|uniref:CD63 antigen-like n=1 Tax=Xenia sp. Carnegie-2017 TaxID=2897299 RepID=UPI001F039552|nr:CD63 antigen-like [Xenia sp. Carnegie-2017]
MGVGVKVAQTLLVAFNFVFVLIGIGSITVGIVIHFKYNDYENLLSKDIGAVPILLISIGGVIFLVSFFGCCGAWRKSVVMLTIYIFLLSLLLLLEIAGVISAYFFKSKLRKYVETGMKDAIKQYNDTKYQKAINKVQQKFDCCGATNSSDYINQKIPSSCCKTPMNVNGTCEFQSKGCADKLFDYLDEHLAIVGGIVIGVIVVQLFGIMFACAVRRNAKEGYGYV